MFILFHRKIWTTIISSVDSLFLFICLSQLVEPQSLKWQDIQEGGGSQVRVPMRTFYYIVTIKVHNCQKNR